MEIDVKDWSSKAASLTLHESGDHFLELRDGDYVIARFSANGASLEEILKEADKYLTTKGDETKGKGKLSKCLCPFRRSETNSTPIELS